MNLARAVGWCVALALAFAAAAGERADEPFTPGDFAFHRAIEIHAEGPLQTLFLDRLVYEGTVEPGLADLRVMNGAGEAVPHAVRRLSAPMRRPPASVALTVFELSVLPPPGASPTAGRGDIAGFRIRAEVSPSGALVEVDSRPPVTAAGPSDGPNPPAYVIDASQLAEPIEWLELDLSEGEPGFVAPVRVEGSDDLARFEIVAGDAALVRLEEAGHRIERRRIHLGAVRNRYLRLRWLGDRPPVRVVGARAHLRSDAEAPPRLEAQIAGEPVAGESGVFRFDLGGPLPVDRAQVRMPGRNTLVQARIRSAPEPDGPWQLVWEGLLYDLDRGEGIQNPELAWPVSRHRWLELEVTSGGGLDEAAPWLEVRWHPEQLLFVARGAPPYRLVHGRFGMPASSFAAADLLEAARPGELPRETARLGEAMGRGDPSLLEPPPPPRPLRTWALWAVLIVAVGVVLALSGSLLRELRADDLGEGPP